LGNADLSYKGNDRKGQVDIKEDPTLLELSNLSPTVKGRGFFIT
tara:strand:+ start:64 stop:195 length:132 start_codon:yes stop_codon:yes gene_type:complete